MARIGGDEFAFLVPGIVNRRQAEVFAKRVIGGFARPFMLANQHLYVTATIGITLCPAMAWRATSCCATPNRRCLPPSGRDGCSAATVPPCAKVRQRHQMQQDLAEAIKLEQLTMAYQPIWDNRSGRVAAGGAGALVPPALGPGVAGGLHSAGGGGGAHPGAGALVLWQSCRDLARLQQSGFPDLQMSINRSTLGSRP